MVQNVTIYTAETWDVYRENRSKLLAIEMDYLQEDETSQNTEWNDKRNDRDGKGHYITDKA
jgi:hypothetical protein